MSAIAENRSGKKGQFVYEVARVRERAVKLNQEISRDWLTEKLASCEYTLTVIASSIQLTISASGPGIWVKGSASVQLETNCGICLASTRLVLEPEIRTYWFQRTDDDSKAQNDELTPDDLDREWFDGEMIVLDDLIRDAIMLELPMSPRCGDNCSGLAGYESDEEDKGIDPRLAPLARLKLEKE